MAYELIGLCVSCRWMAFSPPAQWRSWVDKLMD